MKLHKSQFFSFLLFSFLFAISAYSIDFRIWNPYDGLPVRSGVHLCWERNAAVDEQGNTCIVWTDTRSEDRNIWAQLIAPDGNLLWGEEGLLIVNEIKNQETPHVTYSGDGNWIITWTDFRNSSNNLDNGDIYIQKINSDGQRLWTPENGVIVCNSPCAQSYAKSFPDNIGGTITLWMQYNTNMNTAADIMAGYTDRDGNSRWGNEGILVAGGLGNQGDVGNNAYSACSDNHNGVIFAYQDSRNPCDVNVYANRLTIDGELVWADSSGLAVCMHEAWQSNVKICADGFGGAFLTWEDRITYNSTGIDIYFQHLNADGVHSFEMNGLALCNNENDQYNQRIVKANRNEFIVAWLDRRDEAVNGIDIYAQKVTMDDITPHFLWGQHDPNQMGISVCNAPSDQQNVRISPDLHGGVYASWTTQHPDHESDTYLYIQHVNHEGTLCFNNDQGIILSNSEWDKYGNLLRTNNNDRITIFWLEFLAGIPTLLQQKIDSNGTIFLDPNGSVILEGLTNNVDYLSITLAYENECFVTWRDERHGRYGSYPYLQKINCLTGETLFAPNGLSLTPGFPFSEQDSIVLNINGLTTISDGNGGNITAWTDERYESGDFVFVQKTDSQGNFLWDEGGIPISNTPFYGTQNINMFSAGNGNTIIIYNHWNDNWSSVIRAQMIDENGECLWSEDGIVIIGDDHFNMIQSAIQFDDQSVLIVYMDSSNWNIFGQKLLINGENAWAQPVPLRTIEGRCFQAESVVLNNNAFVTWQDRRNGTNNNIVVQGITPEGNLIFQENGLLLTSNENYHAFISLKSNGTFFWMTWLGENDGNLSYYLQKYTTSFEPLLAPAPGIPFGCANNSVHDRATIINDTNGGVYLLWEQIQDNLSDLYYTHIDCDGNLVDDNYSYDGLPLSKADNKQFVIKAIPDEEGGFFAVWQDSRQTLEDNEFCGIYMQRVNDWIVSVNNTPDIQPEGWSLETAYPNPFNPSTRIAFQVGATSHVKLTVYDILGREVVKLVNGNHEAGNHIVTWNGKDTAGQMVASGTYFYRLEADDVLLTKSMVLVK